MASVTQKIPTYVLGMSTQPDERKAPGQVVDLVNGVPDVVRQLIKRPGSQLVTAISPSTVALVSTSNSPNEPVEAAEPLIFPVVVTVSPTICSM